MKKSKPVWKTDAARNSAVFHAAARLAACCAFFAVMLCGGCSDNGLSYAFAKDMMPETPLRVDAQATSSSSIVIKWKSVSKAEDYVVYSKDNYDGYDREVGTTSSNSFTHNGLSSNTTYTYTVSAQNRGVRSPGSSQVSATTPISVPSGVTATTVSLNSITVSWSQVSGATGYYVYRSTSDTGTYSKVGTVTSATTTTFTNTGLSPNATYYYKVSAYNGVDETPLSSYTSAKTKSVDTPSGVTAKAESSSSITVSWTAVSGATGYYVYRSTSANGTGTYSKIDSTTSTSYTNTGLSPRTTYYYKVSAYNGGGESFQSSVVSALTSAIDPPTGVTATATSSSSVTVSWAAVPGATGYYVYRSTSVTGTYSKVGTVTSATTTTFTNTGLSSSSVYYYKVSAYNSGGESLQSAHIGATTTGPTPSAPTGVTATAASPSGITVSWSEVSVATGYNVYRSTSANGTYTKVGTTSSTSYTDTGLRSGTTYYYDVSAYNSNGEGSQSSSVSARTKLDALTGLTAVREESTGNITLSWSAVSGADNYWVSRSDSATGYYYFVSNTSSTSYTTTRSTDVAYYYQVCAQQYGDEESSCVSVAVAPRVPSDVTASGASASAISVSWSAVERATGYRVYRSTSASGTYSRVGTTSSATYTNTGLSSGTTYYYKVTAYNDGGESAQSSVASALIFDWGELNDDRDGKKYKTIEIGGMTWMAENLNYPADEGSWCYGNSISNCAKYGRLYDWNTAMSACPSGWHLPSREEWGELAIAAGGTGDYGDRGTAGTKLKSRSGWNNNGNGTDDYGFSALPGGNRYYNSGVYFHTAGDYGLWWTATENGRSNAYRRYMSNYDRVDESNDDKSYGFSVRCVGD